MGNIECLSSPFGDNLCISREFPSFIPPFTDNITYDYDFFECDEGIQLDGKVLPCDERGFQITNNRPLREGPKWCIVKEYEISKVVSRNTAMTRLYVSGRLFIQFMAPASVLRDAKGVCVFSICLRGKPVYEHVQGFPNSVHKFNSGIFFNIYLVNQKSVLHVAPQIRLVNDQCHEVPLCEDVLGPITRNNFFVDFAIVDDGRNLQMDTIVRVPEGKTFRSCIQDYTMYNSGAPNPMITLGYSNLQHYTSNATVFLQNLCIGEREFEDAPGNKVFDWTSETQLFQGVGAICTTTEEFEPSLLHHPQYKPLDMKTMEEITKKQTLMDKSRLTRFLTNEALSSTIEQNEATSKFWYHIRYDMGDNKNSGAGSDENSKCIEGEFWLSRQPLRRGEMYFQTSSSVSQSLVSGIVFRFSCPNDFMTLIEAGACRVLRHTHIPTNGIAFGIEEDPADPNMLRMFIEHRSRIVEDMIVCNCPRTNVRDETLVHHEVFDEGAYLYYRITIIHTDMSQQSCVLRIKEDNLEFIRGPPGDFFGRISKSPSYSNHEKPSPRFPISPALSRHVLPEGYRIMLYSSISYDSKKAVEWQKKEFLDIEQGHSAGTSNWQSLAHTPQGDTSNVARSECDGDEVAMCLAATNSDCGDDGHPKSVGGLSSSKMNLLHLHPDGTLNVNNLEMTNGTNGCSRDHSVSPTHMKGDCAENSLDENPSSSPKLGSMKKSESESESQIPNVGWISGGFLETKIEANPRPVVWRRELIESSVVCLLSRTPFECFPRSIT